MHPLDHMLRARSVAVVGASARPGSVGEQTLRQLRAGGFDGTVYPINPGYDSLLGEPCYPGIDRIDDTVDLAVLAVGNDKLEEEAGRALRAGARSLAIFASCHGVSEDGSPLRDRLASMAEQAGAPICGGNGMGFVNLEERLRVCGFYQPDRLSPGGISFLTHSGSLFSAMLHNRRGLRFNLAVSTGLEMTTPMSHYLDWVLDLESTRVIALFVETTRDPRGFVAGLERAGELGIPVVALKVGASTRGQAAVSTHSEAIAGDDAVYEALFDSLGVHRVLTMDEMVDTVEILATDRRPRPGGLGAVHDSGGERALLIDTAERVGVPLPDLSEITVERLTRILDPGLEPANPVDAWGTGRDSQQVFVACLDALASDPAIGVVAFCVDLTAEERMEDAYGLAALKAAENTEKPIVVLANVATTVDPAQADLVRSAGVPVLEGTETGLRAIKHLLTRAERQEWPAPEPRITLPWRGPTAGLDPSEVLDWYGIPMARTIEAQDRSSALAGADESGYPVVLKTLGPDHKTEVNGVVLGIDGPQALSLAYDEISGRLGPAVTISEQIETGIEMGLGWSRTLSSGRWS
jgi:acyl-CoA synthetase (NDP forming)